ncbi:MAG: hypothetical protein ACREM2_09815, partial [Vulcanimicrobiaceae bacterium]
LRADAGRSRVRLTWRPASGRVAGYLVERRAAGETRWADLNARPNPVPRYDDQIYRTYGALAYRVRTVGFDSRIGPPSNEVSVTLVQVTLPPAPRIRAASGRGGVATLAFIPGTPASASARFIVTRSGALRDVGVVLGEPLPGDARSYTDRFVRAGATYWYRLYALDRAGNRSDPSDPVVVRVAAVALVAAAPPHLQLASAPFRRVTLTFALAPPGAQTVVQRRVGSRGPWLDLASPYSGTFAVDAAPPGKSVVSYRIYYRGRGGATGAPSPPVEVTIP